MPLKSDSQPPRRSTDASRCLIRLPSILSQGSAPKPGYQDPLDLYLSKKQSRDMSDFEAHSFSIIRSNQLWDQFREEARAKQITTAGGIREMLKEKYVTGCRKHSEPKEDVIRRQRSISWAVDEEDIDLLEAMRTFAPCHESYRNRIRGDTEGIMSLYVNDLDANRRGSSCPRVAKLDSKPLLSMPSLLPNQDRSRERAGSKSWVSTLVDRECSPVVDRSVRPSDSKFIKRKVSFGSDNKTYVASESFMPKEREGDDVSTHFSSNTLSAKRKSMSDDDLSSQYSDGSMLLVEWGECEESSNGETNHECENMNAALSGLVLNM
ncbi:hypothetical protein ACHAW6_005365 [Cyclotella cf. meneghiniana]